jgi:hypothetical protein
MIALGCQNSSNGNKKITFLNKTDLSFIKEYTLPDSADNNEFQKISITTNNRYLIAEAGGAHIYDLQTDNLLKVYNRYFMYFPLNNDSLVLCGKYIHPDLDSCHFIILNIFTGQEIYEYPDIDTNSYYTNHYDVNSEKTAFLADLRIKGTDYFYWKLAKINIIIPTNIFGESVQISESIFYPNPSDGKVKIKLNYIPTNKIEIKLFDLNGNLIKDVSNDYIQFDSELDVNYGRLDIGTYFIEVRCGSNRTTSKLIIRNK